MRATVAAIGLLAASVLVALLVGREVVEPGPTSAAPAAEIIVVPPEPAAASSRPAVEESATDRLPTADLAAPVPGEPCDAAPVTADRLDREFDGGIEGMVGADYQRAFELDDGRVLWVFQDAFIDLGVAAPTLVHNAAVIQDGLCFDVIADEAATPRSWAAADRTTPLRRWYWPLDGYQSDADTFTLFLAEVEERGDRYLANATPVATWWVEIDVDTLRAGEAVPAPDASDALYGFDVTTDESFVYLYAHCHRQFGFGPGGHDACATDVTIARQPLGDRDAALTYWDGDAWSDDPDDAVNIAPVAGPDGELRAVNPMQIDRDGGRWIAVTLVGDWWGDAVHFDVAPRPEGPWTTTSVRPLTPVDDGGEVASYFVSFVPSDEAGRTIAVSNNRWDGRLSEHYRPRFDSIGSLAWAARSAVEVAEDVWLPLGTPIADGVASGNLQGSFT